MLNGKPVMYKLEPRWMDLVWFLHFWLIQSTPVWSEVNHNVQNCKCWGTDTNLKKQNQSLQLQNTLNNWKKKLLLDKILNMSEWLNG